MKNMNYLFSVLFAQLLIGQSWLGQLNRYFLHFDITNGSLAAKATREVLCYMIFIER